MKLLLAPLAGFTDAPFRRLATEGGADQTYTEMVSAAGLAHGNQPTRELMKVLPGEGPVGCQIFGAKETDVARATHVVESVKERFCELNLNAGCPMTKVTRCGAGAKLAEDPAQVYRLLQVMRENTTLPVTLKTRLGPRPDWETVFELLDAATQAGVRALLLHARYTSQLHGGAVHLEKLAAVVARARIPVIGNGSVVDHASYEAMAQTGVSGILIGRAALVNPDIFNVFKGCAPRSRQDCAAAHLKYLIESGAGERLILTKFRTHLFRYFAGTPGAAALRARIHQSQTLQEVCTLCSLHHSEA